MSRQPWAHRRTRIGLPTTSLERGWAKRTVDYERPFPVAPLARRLGISVGGPRWAAQLSDAVGVDRRWIYRYREWGLTRRQADEWATRAGVHPAEVWATWDDLDRLRGAALRNASKETCGHGHPLDAVDSRGFRFCTVCRRAQNRMNVRNLRIRRSQDSLTRQEAS